MIALKLSCKPYLLKEIKNVIKQTKKQTLKQFKEFYLEEFKKSNPIQYKALKKDKPMMRMMWLDWLDALNREGILTNNQVYNWTNPF